MIRVVDVAKTTDIAVDPDVTLEALVNESAVVVDYLCASGTAVDAGAKPAALHYAHAKSLVLESEHLREDAVNTLLSR